MDRYTYKLVNKNLLLTNVLEDYDHKIIFSNMLSIIDDYLSVLINNNIKLDNINFDHLLCVECIPNYGPYELINRATKFDIKKLEFVNVDDDTDISDVDDTHWYPINSIKKKLQTKQKIIHNKPTEATPNIIKPIPKITQPIIETPKTNVIEISKVEEPTIVEPQQDPQEILNMIEQLKKLKEDELNSMKVLKEKLEVEEDKIIDKQNVLGDIKRDAFKHKEKEEDNKRVFIADKKAYFMIKMDIYTKKLEESKVSPLFQDKYVIFKYLDERGILNSDDEYVHYVTLYNELYPEPEIIEERYVPHNLHYLSEEEQKKYEHIKNSNKDMIEEFINGKEKLQIEPLEDILRKVDDEDNEDNNNMFGDVNFGF